MFSLVRRSGHVFVRRSGALLVEEVTPKWPVEMVLSPVIKITRGENTTYRCRSADAWFGDFGSLQLGIREEAILQLEITENASFALGNQDGDSFATGNQRGCKFCNIGNQEGGHFATGNQGGGKFGNCSGRRRVWQLEISEEAILQLEIRKETVLQLEIREEASFATGNQ